MSGQSRVELVSMTGEPSWRASEMVVGSLVGNARVIGSANGSGQTPVTAAASDEHKFCSCRVVEVKRCGMGVVMPGTRRVV